MEVKSTAQSRKVMREAQAFVATLAILEGNPVAIEKVVNCIEAICCKYYNPFCLLKTDEMIILSQKGETVGALTISGDSFGRVNSLGIIYGAVH